MCTNQEEKHACMFYYESILAWWIRSPDPINKIIFNTCSTSQHIIFQKTSPPIPIKPCLSIMLCCDNYENVSLLSCFNSNHSFPLKKENAKFINGRFQFWNFLQAARPWSGKLCVLYCKREIGSIHVAPFSCVWPLLNWRYKKYNIHTFMAKGTI